MTNQTDRSGEKPEGLNWAPFWQTTEDEPVRWWDLWDGDEYTEYTVVEREGGFFLTTRGRVVGPFSLLVSAQASVMMAFYEEEPDKRERDHRKLYGRASD